MLSTPSRLSPVAGVAFPGPFPAGEGWIEPCFDVQADFLDALSYDDMDALDHILAQDCVLLFPGIRPVMGAPLVKRVLRSVRRRYNVLSFQAVLQLRSPRDFLIVTSMVRGMRKDGVPYANEVMSLIRLDEDGRVAMISDYFKSTTFLTERAERFNAIV